MPPSQLKRLRTSLREQGITGAQKSKKQKKAAKQGKNASDRIQRNVALQQIRDSFNPFEIQAPSRPPKFQHANSAPANGASKGSRYKDVLHRPGVSKSAGEEMRRAKLLPEMQRRNKVGGLVDRRIGEDDPDMTAEERAVKRFAQEKQRRKGASLFDLEASDDDDDDARMGLTHGGRSLGDLPADDFGEDVSQDEGSEEDGDLMRRKRRRSDSEEVETESNGKEEADEQPDRKKSKKEVMEEVIAKSKYHKYERQKAKEDDDDLREELDSGMGDIMALLRGHKPAPPPSKPEEPEIDRSEPTMNPDRQRLLDGQDRARVDKEYDARIKQLAQDTRAQPSNRTKTEEEKVKEEAERLKALEERRTKRMRGEDTSDDEVQTSKPVEVEGDAGGDDDVPDEAAEFGFTASNARPKSEKEQVVLEDEDEFALDEDLIASESDADIDEDSGSEQSSDDEDDGAAKLADEEDEFVKDILGDVSDATTKVNGDAQRSNVKGLAYTYPCPRTHEQLLDVIKDTPVAQLPTIIQRIRALHHPSLSAANKEATADFSSALVDHLSYMGLQKQPLAVVEQVIRHLHSLSRTYAEVIANAFRRHLQSAHERRELRAGDLVILTAIGSIYPTSDHFHQVVTPATTLIARWLGMVTPDTAHKHATGAFLVALCINYQKLSKRYIPEAISFTFRALSSKPSGSPEQKQAHVDNLLSMARLWTTKPAFTEIFTPFLPLLENQNLTKPLQPLRILLSQSHSTRRPLELHHHRPLPIRTSIPKFEGEFFNPDKHYDPDKERSDARKLQKEYKREKKGAVRELRKDAQFVAREQLREKVERDREYERKYRRLVAEVQGEEGHEGKVYEGEKRRRKMSKGKK